MKDCPNCNKIIDATLISNKFPVEFLYETGFTCKKYWINGHNEAFCSFGENEVININCGGLACRCYYFKYKKESEMTEQFDPSKPFRLADGREVRNVCLDYLITKGVTGISAIVRNKAGSHDYVGIWQLNGKNYHGEGDIMDYDLVNIPEKVEGWINIYENDVIFKDKVIADIGAHPTRIACILINFTKGEGVMTDHYCVKCKKCHKVIRQCRCWRVGEKITYQTCNECENLERPKVAK